MSLHGWARPEEETQIGITRAQNEFDSSGASSSVVSSEQRRTPEAESTFSLLSADDILSSIPAHPSPIYSQGNVSRPSFHGTTACTTPALRNSWTEIVKEKESLEINVTPLQPVSSCRTTFDVRLDRGHYQLKVVHKNDDHEQLPPFKRFMVIIAPFFTFMSIVAYLNYFFWRVKATVDAQHFAHRIFHLAWFFIAAEAIIALPGTFHNFWLILAIRHRRRPQLRLVGELAPTVDVFITTCGEDADIVMDTTVAACAVDYPPDRFRVVVLDDHKVDTLRVEVEKLMRVFPNLYYHRRVKPPPPAPHHFKAGNLIGGTDMVTKLEGGAGEYIAALDADMIPEPDWLRAIVAHAVNDDKVALVCPPQLFYNVPPNDPLVQSLDAFVHVLEPAKDAAGVAWCTGSGYIIRRSALESIGGWPLGSLAEDVCTSSMLLGAGWKTVYCHEGLQYGLVPDTWDGHLKQRTRWTLGTIQTACKLRFFLFGSLLRKMTFFQRLSGFVFSVDALFKIFFPIAIATIPVVLAINQKLVAYRDEKQLRWLIRWCLVMFLAQRLNEWIMYLPSGYRLSRHEGRAIIWMAPYHALTVVRAVLPKWAGGASMGFKPSGSLNGGLSERSASERAPLLQRLKFIIIDSHGWFHVCFILFTAGSVAYATSRAWTDTDRSTFKILESLLTHAFWPPVMWLIILSALCQPIKYAINPPTMPDREAMLDRDPATGIAHPKREFRVQKWTQTHHTHEFMYVLMSGYTIFLFVGTFIHWKTVNNKTEFWFSLN
ncbi:hypothetical protein EJ08DRAFT_615815 [Tothia fuscella]|uniref:Glycosyltransferase 2-like domain-containing protein n=1 Tax=Tothia fuscella TaxID=1048955 RepID=A0A9P4NMI5_9PEZI|nr:hypothetical protein EJ08DRAFT_615815 [Tothia fuscella]